MNRVHPIIHDLLVTGAWPVGELNTIEAEAIQTAAPDETRIFLSRPEHFHTVAEEMHGNEEFWKVYGALSEIDPSRSLIIGDFGLGSDTAIIIDSDTSIPDPQVLRLKWCGEANSIQNHWVVFFDRLSDFATFLKKQKMKYQHNQAVGRSA